VKSSAPAADQKAVPDQVNLPAFLLAAVVPRRSGTPTQVIAGREHEQALRFAAKVDKTLENADLGERLSDRVSTERKQGGLVLVEVYLDGQRLHRETPAAVTSGLLTKLAQPSPDQMSWLDRVEEASATGVTLRGRVQPLTLSADLMNLRRDSIPKRDVFDKSPITTEDLQSKQSSAIQEAWRLFICVQEHPEELATDLWPKVGNAFAVKDDPVCAELRAKCLPVLMQHLIHPSLHVREAAFGVLLRWRNADESVKNIFDIFQSIVRNLSIGQAATFLDKAVSTVNEHAQNQKIGEKIGRNYLFSKYELTEFRDSAPGPGRPKSPPKT
jgi:hypothetical protein